MRNVNINIFFNEYSRFLYIAQLESKDQLVQAYELNFSVKE